MATPDQISITLSTQGWHVVLAGLDELPHKVSRRVIDAILAQDPGTKQQPAPAPPPVVEAPVVDAPPPAPEPEPVELP